MARISRRELLQRTAAVVATAAITGAGLLPESHSIGAAAEEAGASTKSKSDVGGELAALTAWYTAMNSTDGKTVYLFRDSISYLLAYNSIWGGTGLQKFSWGGQHNVKNYYVKNWNSNSQYMQWNINSAVKAKYHIDALIGQKKGVTLRVQVGAYALDKTLSGDSRDRVALGQITVPKGNSTLTISVPSGPFEMTLMSLELYPAAAGAAISRSIAKRKTRATWMGHAPMGMMYQWGQWGGNAEGQGSPWPICYANFNYEGFAQRLKDEGADFLVWSITYAEYYIAAPIASVDQVLKGRTCETDYLDRLLTECQKRDVKVIFYYHAGHSRNPWWDSFWTAPLEANEVYARKEEPMNKFLSIFSEIGHRYGDKLAGWMIDDAGIYYPAPFEKLSDALKAGNRDRIISFNSAYMFDFAPRMTEYEDYYFGETPKGKTVISWPTDAQGVYTEGPFVGEHAFANFQTESGNWGYFNDASAARIGMRPDHSLNTTMTAETFKNIALQAAQTHAMAAYDFRMYEDGTQSQNSLDRFKTAAALAHASS